MFDIIQNIIGHNWVTGSSDQQYIYYISGALIIMLTSIFIDMVYRVFSHFWRGGK